jgi:rubrerythrin
MAVMFAADFSNIASSVAVLGTAAVAVFAAFQKRATDKGANDIAALRERVALAESREDECWVRLTRSEERITELEAKIDK